MSTFKTSFIGNNINSITSGRLLPLSDQKKDFQIPKKFLSSKNDSKNRNSNLDPEKSTANSQTKSESETETETEMEPSNRNTLDLVVDEERDDLGTKEKNEIGQDWNEKEDLKDEEGNDIIIVDWYDENDEENPQNWSKGKKILTTFCICLLTFAVYGGASIYTPSIPGLIQEFDVSQRKGLVGLSLYVFAYGLGPMILSPLSDIPSIGRTNVYIATLFLFIIFSIPAAIAPTYSTLMACRFFTGFFGSPALATGGASISDIFSEKAVPKAISIWSIGAVSGTVLCPVLAGYAAQHVNWRLPLWLLLAISGLVLILLIFFLPETLPGYILLRRAQRLRNITGNPNLKSRSEVEQANLTTKAMVEEHLLLPIYLCLDPAVFFANGYLAVAYFLFYQWFESFPIVFGEIYHFSLGAQGLPFLGIAAGAAVTLPCYLAYLHFIVDKRQVQVPEDSLEASLAASIFIPISQLIFGWTSRPSIHFMVPIFGSSLYLPGLFLLFQSMLTYLPKSYKTCQASVLASNDLFRSTIASVAPLIGSAFFRTLGLGGGSSLLAGLSIIMIPFLFLLKKHGAKLRARSKYAST